MPTVCDYVCLWGWTGRELHAVKSTRLTHNGLWASISEQRVVRRLGFLLTDPYQFDILRSSPACGRPNAAQSIETARFHRAARQRGAASINIPAEPKPSGVIVKGRRHALSPHKIGLEWSTCKNRLRTPDRRPWLRRSPSKPASCRRLASETCS